MNQSTKIIENGYVFTGDRQNRTGQFTLLIQNGCIADIGKPAEVLKSLYPAAEVVDAKGKVVLPGFVDAHHTGVSFILRYLTSAYPMSKWNKVQEINRTIEYLRNEATYEEFLVLFRLSYFAALKAGITTIAEYGFDNPEQSFPATLEAMHQTNIKGFIGLHNGDQIEAARKVQNPLVRFAFVIVDEEDITTYNLQSTIRSAQELQWPIILHLGQTRRASDIIKKNFNKSILQLYSDYRVLDYPVHLLHLSFYEEGDLDILAKCNVPLIISPMAILQKDTDIPPLEELLKRKIPIALGTDWGLPQPLKNIQTYCLISKMLGLSPTRAFDLLSLLTRNGAKALGLENEIGSIEIGKKADIVFINLSDFRVSSVMANDNAEKILDVVLQETISQQISEVMINGEFYVREGHNLTYSEEELAAESEKLFRKLFSSNGQKKSSISTSATILQMPKQNKEETVSFKKDLPFEEGFRVVKKGSQSDNLNEDDSRSEDKKSKLPDNVKKIFGDDDV